MSWKYEHSKDPGVPPTPGLAPLLAGLVLGLVAMGATPFVYYWLLMPLVPFVLGAVVVLVSLKAKRLWPVAEGLLAATVFGVVFVAVAFAGLSSMA